jgi:VanZ family protein
MKKIIYKNAVVWALLWALVIFILCATPGQYIPSANWLELLSFDKLVHASMFFILTTLLFIVAVKYNQQKLTIAVYFLIAVMYGGSLEIMQALYFSNRSADWKDMVANTFGCVVALLCLKKLRLMFKPVV